jgi:hypothetical protein
MRLARVFGSALIVLFLAGASTAQTRGPKRKAAEDKAARAAEKHDKAADRADKPSDKSTERGDKGDKPDKTDKVDKPEAETFEPAGGSKETAGDLGDAPPQAVREENADKKLSPLTPEANEFPAGAVKPAPAEFDKLLGDIAALRGRISALTRTLFASKLRVVIEADGDDAQIANLVVMLDDGVVYSAPERSAFGEERTVYEHAVAPGYHVLGVNIERSAALNSQYRTWQNSKFSVLIPEGKLTEARVVLSDDSEMAEDFPDDQDGEYDLRVKLRARVED